MSFRIKAKRLFLTYSRCPNNWTKDYIKEMLVDGLLVHRKGKEKYKTKVKSYVIAEEKHQEPEDGEYEKGHHFHCLVELDKEIHIERENYLDIEQVHGNYQAVNDVFATLNYIKKYGNYIADGFPGLKNASRNILMANTEEDAKMQLIPKMTVKEKLNFREELVTRIERRTVIEEITTQAPLYAFQEILMPFHKGAGFFSKGRPVGIIMQGEPESGKTTMAYRIARDLNLDIAVYRDPREMLQYTQEQVILFDEMTAERFKENRDLFCLLVTEPHASTKSYFGNKRIKWPRKVLIATNEDVEQWDCNRAVKARFIVIKTYADNTYKFQRFKNNQLEEISLEEIKSLLDSGSD